MGKPIYLAIWLLQHSRIVTKMAIANESFNVIVKLGNGNNTQQKSQPLVQCSFLALASYDFTGHSF